jgi:hypothetical protein
MFSHQCVAYTPLRLMTTRARQSFCYRKLLPVESLHITIRGKVHALPEEADIPVMLEVVRVTIIWAFDEREHRATLGAGSLLFCTR